MSAIKYIPLLDTLPAPLVKPVVTEITARVGELGCGCWVLYRGNYYVTLGLGQLAGPIGSATVYLPLEMEVQLVELRVQE